MRNAAAVLLCFPALLIASVVMAQTDRTDVFKSRIKKFNDDFHVLDGLEKVRISSANSRPLAESIHRLRQDISTALGKGTLISADGLGVEVESLRADLVTLRIHASGIGADEAGRVMKDMDAISPAARKAIDQEIADTKKAGAALGRGIDREHAAAARTIAAGHGGAHELEQQAYGTLAKIRLALMNYYGDTKGKRPRSLAGLVPKYLPAVPPVQLPGSPKTNKVTPIAKDADGADLAPAVKETGGWLYVADKTSRRYGEVHFDSTRKSGDQKPYYQY